MPLFNDVTLRTPESVALKFTLAGIGNRAYALFIDYLLWLVTLIVFVWGWIPLSERLVEMLTPLLSDRIIDNLELWLIATYLLLGFAIYMGYFVLFEVWWQGQTPGKRWVNIRVIQENGRPARLPQALLRSLLRPVDDILFLGAIIMLLNRREKRIGDWLAGTLVIQEDHTREGKVLQISEAAQVLGEDVLKYAPLDRLSPEDFTILRTYLQRQDQMLPTARRAKSTELAQQVRSRLNNLEVPESTSPLTVLQAVYWAYQQTYGDRL